MKLSERIGKMRAEYKKNRVVPSTEDLLGLACDAVVVEYQLEKAILLLVLMSKTHYSQHTLKLVQDFLNSYPAEGRPG